MHEVLSFSFSLQDILDPSKNFIKDDTIILQAKVEADAPHGIKLVSLLYHVLLIWQIHEICGLCLSIAL